MTYCVAALTTEGIVFASDSRTNAGVDHISVFSKMTVYEVPGDRVIVMLAAVARVRLDVDALRVGRCTHGAGLGLHGPGRPCPPGRTS